MYKVITPIIGEILLLVVAVLLYLVLYDCFVKKVSIKTAISRRIIGLVFGEGTGWIVYLLGLLVVAYLVLIIFF